MSRGLLAEVRAKRLLREARTIRLRAGVSTRRVAAELGVHAATVARWERSESHPRERHLLRYAELLAMLLVEGEAA